jgi:hypothetical protein
MTESKKAWVTPELIVLVRSKPEEAVLVACKAWGGPWGGADPQDVQEGCSTTACVWCTAKVMS